MKAIEAYGIAKLREKYGLTIDAIEKEAKKGNFELDASNIEYGESTYWLLEEEMNFLRRLGYKIYINESNVDFMPDQQIISWNLDE